MEAHGWIRQRISEKAKSKYTFNSSPTISITHVIHFINKHVDLNNFS